MPARLSTAEMLNSWRNDPVKFVRDVFRVEPDAWQAEVLHAFPKHQRIAMNACKGPGKSCVEAWLIWNFLLTRPFPKVACTSITGDNLADGLWTELAKWRGKSELIKDQFEWTKTRIFHKVYYETWYCTAKTWPKGADARQQADTLAGLHADYIFFVLDEAGGIPDSVMAAAEASLASPKEGKLLIGGNPTHTEGPLYRASTSERHLWYVVNVTGDPEDPNRSPRISMDWAKEQIEKYGKDNPWVLVNVFGRFPPSSINTLISVDEVEKSMRRKLKHEDYRYAQRRIGVDVARFGDDKTVIFCRQGLNGREMPVELRNARTDEIAARLMVAKNRFGSEMEFVDDTGGYGAGVIDNCIQAGLSPMGIHFSGRASDARYINKRAEMWFGMVEWIKRGGCLPNIPELIRELTAPTYTFQNGKFRIEDKKQIKERLGFSPDYADALALTFAIEETPTTEINETMLNVKHQQNKAESDFDPFDEDRW